MIRKTRLAAVAATTVLTLTAAGCGSSGSDSSGSSGSDSTSSASSSTTEDTAEAEAATEAVTVDDACALAPMPEVSKIIGAGVTKTTPMTAKGCVYTTDSIMDPSVTTGAEPVTIEQSMAGAKITFGDSEEVDATIEGADEAKRLVGSISGANTTMTFASAKGNTVFVMVSTSDVPAAKVTSMADQIATVMVGNLG